MASYTMFPPIRSTHVPFRHAAEGDLWSFYSQLVTYVDLRPDDTRPVQVLHTDGIWYDGELEAYRKTDGVWSGWVRYHVAIGAQHIGWFTEERLRRPGT